jgi:hypothetical protein
MVFDKYEGKGRRLLGEPKQGDGLVFHGVRINSKAGELLLIILASSAESVGSFSAEQTPYSEY